MVAPLRWRLAPGHFETAGDRVGTLAGTKAALPAEALLLEAGCLAVRTDELRVTRAVRLTETVAAGDQRHRFFVVHRHAREGLSDVAGRRDGVGIAIRALGVHVDEAHLHRSQRILEVAFAGVTPVIEPGFLGAPVHVLIRLPNVFATAAEAEGLEAHRFERDVPG